MSLAKVASQNAWINGARKSIFFAVHGIALVALFIPFSWIAFGVCIALYLIRMFAITGGYHRYFSHRTYKTSRLFQFILGFLGASSAQKGPLWWASHHRHHHQHSDTAEDMHSPKHHGIWYAHVGWVLSPSYLESRPELVRDLTRYRELRWLDQYHLIAPVLLALAVYYFGVACETFAPSLGVSGWQMLIWGFFVSTVLLYHGTFLVNSAAHLIGTRRFETGDESRNSLLIALLTLGEGWHNNHHRFPGSERQGFYWWEIDITHYTLKLLNRLGLVWDLREPPARIYEEAAQNAAVS